MKQPIIRSLVVALFFATATVAYAQKNTAESTIEFVDDAAITAKVKAALLNDSGLKSFAIGVETYKDSVQLSGFVDTDELKTRAGTVSASVTGVKAVRNDLVVK